MRVLRFKRLEEVIEAAMDLYLYERGVVLKSLLLFAQKMAYMSESCAANTDTENPDINVSALESERRWQ